MSGWIKKHRKMVDWVWYKDVPTCRLFDHLLMIVNYKPQMFMGRMVSSGQTATGRSSLSQDTGLTEQQIRTALNKLKSTNDITIEATSHFSIITIVNWSNYQFHEIPSTNQNQTNQPTSNTQSTTIKEINKISSYEDIITDNTRAREKSRGSRLHDDWKLPDDWKHEALRKTVLNEQTISLEAEIFKNYWIAAAGAKGRKADWKATWRNWIIRKDQNVRNQNSYKQGFGRFGNSGNGGSKDTGQGFGGRPSQSSIAKERSEEIIRKRLQKAAEAENQGLLDITDTAHETDRADIHSIKEIR